MGKVYKRKDSAYYWLAYKRGNRRVRESSGARNKSLAEEILRHREAEALCSPRGGYVYQRKAVETTLAEYLDWVKINKRFHTLRSYRTILGIFRAYIEKQTPVKHLKDISPKVLEDYKMYRLKVSKTTTVKNHIIVLKAFFSKIVEWGYLHESPAKWLRSVEITDSKPIRYLTEDEYTRFMEICRKDFSLYYPMFYTFIHTGMRKAELLSLDWDDIDLKKGYIYVRSKEGFMPKGITKKTGRAKERIIPIHDGVKKVIKSIPRTTGKVFDQHNRPRRILLKIAKKAELKGLSRLHELRHSYASFLLKKGVDIYKIKELLGHSDIRDTMKYAHLPTVHMKDDVDQLRELDRR